MYAVPIPPLGRSGWVVIARFPAMLSENTFDPVKDALSATCTVNVKVPDVCGVPLIVPVWAFRLRSPSEPPVTVQVYG